ncbi:hypothetical protein MASR1M12_01260 [Erysipelotrichia bacterium]
MIAARLETLIKKRKISQAEFARQIGVERMTVSKWVGDKSNPSYEDLLKISDFFDVSTDFLLGKNENSTGQLKRIPILDSLPDGDFLLEKKHHQNEIFLHKGFAKLYDFGYLVQDRSMENAGILFLDIVFLQRFSEAVSGNICLVKYDGAELLARVFVEKDHIILKRENNLYKPLLITVGKGELRFVGKVTGLFRPDMHVYTDPEKKLEK